MFERPPSPREPLEEVPSPSKALAGLAASLPVLALPVGCVVALPLSAGSFEFANAHHFANGWSFAIIAITMAAGTVVPVLVYLTGLGWRVPSIFAAGTSLLPWLVGIAGTRYGVYQVEEAIAFADSVDRAAVISMGISEALVSRSLGTVFTVALACGTALGLAVAALAQNAPGRSPVGALVAAGPTVMLFAAAALAAPAAGLPGTLLFLVAALTLLVAAIGGSASGTDSKGRSGANAAAGTLLASAAFGVAGLAVEAGETIQVFGALAFVEAESRTSMLVGALAELEPLAVVARDGAGLMALSSIGVIGWAALRSRPSVGRVIGGVLLFVGIGAVFALDVVVQRASVATPEATWEAAFADFQPLVFSSGTAANPPHLVLAPIGAKRFDGRTLEAATLQEDPPSDAAGQVLRELVEGRAPHWERPGASGMLLPNRPQTLAVAADQSTPSALLVGVVRTAEATNIDAIVWTGRLEMQQANFDRLVQRSALLASLISDRVEVTTYLPDPDPRGYEALPTASVGSELRVRVEEPGNEPFWSNEIAAARAARDDEAKEVWLELSPDTSAPALVTVVTDLRRAGYRPIVSAKPRPAIEDPEPEPVPPSTIVAGLEGSGRIRDARADVRGSLSKAQIRSVVRRNIADVQFCYEQALRNHPRLEGRVMVSFIIATTGQVASSTVAASTVDNPTLERCIAGRIRRWHFPEPEGGGIVVVNYPFDLSPS
ncbi:MAG: AgmX/PglI C-terminal domain-containing protein [Myxococcota bacterium]